MKEFCAKAHEKAFGDKVRVDVAILNLRTLLFTNEAYRERRVDVITYSIEDGVPIQERRQYWYMTEGVRPDCVFYLSPAGARVPTGPRDREFKLHRRVCGIKVF